MRHITFTLEPHYNTILDIILSSSYFPLCSIHSFYLTDDQLAAVDDLIDSMDLSIAAQ